MADKRKPAVSGFAKNARSVDVSPLELSYEAHDSAIDLGGYPVTSRGFKEGDKVRSGDREFVVTRQEDGTLVLTDVKSLN